MIWLTVGNGLRNDGEQGKRGRTEKGRIREPKKALGLSIESKIQIIK